MADGPVEARADPPPKGWDRERHSLAFSRDGRSLAAATADDTVEVWDVGRQRLEGPPLVGHLGVVTSVAFKSRRPHARVGKHGSHDSGCGRYQSETSTGERSGLAFGATTGTCPYRAMASSLRQAETAA